MPIWMDCLALLTNAECVNGHCGGVPVSERHATARLCRVVPDPARCPGLSHFFMFLVLSEAKKKKNAGAPLTPLAFPWLGWAGLGWERRLT